MRSQLPIMLEVKATDNKLRTGFDAEIAIAKLTGYALTRYCVGEFDPLYLKVIEWCACKLIELGIVDVASAEEHLRKQEDRFVSMHMTKFSRERYILTRRHKYGNEIINTYVRSRYNFYKDRLPDDVARKQARHEFRQLVLRLRKEKIPLRVIGERFGVSTGSIRQAEAKALRRMHWRSPILCYFEYQDFI